MRINTLFYSIRQGIRGIFRNKMFSFASFATMCICIFMFGLFYIVQSNVSRMVGSAEDGVAVTVFFNEDISTGQLEEMAKQIASRKEVSRVEYTSAEEAWQSFQETYFEGKEELAEGFAEDNPLASCSNFAIYLEDLTKQESLVEYLESLEGVRTVKQSRQVTDMLIDLNVLMSYVSIAVVAVFLLVAVFLISSTIAAGITARREEIAIMKLIGATDFLVRAPFVVEGILLGLIGAAVPAAVLYTMYGKLIAMMSEHFEFLSGIFSLIPQQEIFQVLIPVCLVLGLVMGVFGSTSTLRRHLKV